jgi:phosphate transport system substrate-binding protein
VKLQRHGLTAGLLATALLLAACGGDDENTGGSGGGQQELSGSVRADGSSTVAPLTTAAAEFFAEEQPKVRVTVGTSGTGGGFEKFCNGETDVSDASRPIKDEETAACKAKNIEYGELTVANDALTVVVNKDNTWAQCLTTAQLKKMWEPSSKIDNWNQVDPKFPSEPLKLFGPGTDSGTFDYFTDEINGEEGASRKDYQPSEDDNVIVTGVAGSKGGLGYFGYTYFEENQDKLKAVGINSGSGCVTPSVQTVQDGTYKPLARPLFVYPSVAAMKRPEVAAFVDYYVNNDGKIAEDAKFVPLNEEQKTKLKTEFESLKSKAGS